jgi:hypothetical protein
VDGRADADCIDAGHRDGSIAAPMTLPTGEHAYSADDDRSEHGQLEACARSAIVAQDQGSYGV